MISKVISFSICFLISVFCFLGSARLAWPEPLDELKKALQTNDVEVVWGAIDAIPQKISPQQREETVKVLMMALKKEWPRCTGDIRQSIAMQLASMNAKEAIPGLLELIKEKKKIDHECAE